MNRGRRICIRDVFFIAFALIATIVVGHASMRPTVNAAKDIRFTDCKQGEQVVLDVRSQGCFGGAHYVMRFSKVPGPHVGVTDFGPRLKKDGVTGQWKSEETPLNLGGVLLLPRQVERLDNMLLYYRRHNGQGSCTTATWITVSLNRNGVTVRQERYMDRTCRLEALDASLPDLRELHRTEPPVIAPDRIYTVLRSRQAKGVASSPIHITDYDTDPDALAKEDLATQRTLILSRKLARQRPGYAAMRRIFNVTDTYLGDVNGYPYSLETVLKAKRPRLVDVFWWFDPAPHDRPQHDWNAALALHRRAEAMVAHCSWLRAWKVKSAGRTIGMEALGMQMWTLDEKTEDGSVAWKHAGLRGDKTCQLILERGDNTSMTLYLGAQDSRALLTKCEPAAKTADRTGLDNVTVSYNTGLPVPDYIVVEPNGRWWRNRQPKSTPHTARP